jgi:hypothetical protein
VPTEHPQAEVNPVNTVRRDMGTSMIRTIDSCNIRKNVGKHQ